MQGDFKTIKAITLKNKILFLILTLPARLKFFLNEKILKLNLFKLFNINKNLILLFQLNDCAGEQILNRRRLELSLHIWFCSAKVKIYQTKAIPVEIELFTFHLAKNKLKNRQKILMYILKEERSSIDLVRSLN